jgi:hypothetical protein
MKYIARLNEDFEPKSDTHLELIHEEKTKDGKTYRMYKDYNGGTYTRYRHYLDGKEIDLIVTIFPDPREYNSPKQLNGKYKKHYSDTIKRIDAAKKITDTLKPETLKMIKQKEHESDDEMLRYDEYLSTGGKPSYRGEEFQNFYNKTGRSHPDFKPEIPLDLVDKWEKKYKSLTPQEKERLKRKINKSK